MNGGLPIIGNVLLAQAGQTESLRSHLEWSIPETGWEWLLYGGGFAAAFVFVVWMYLRDTQTMPRVWTVVLTGLRLVTLLGILIVALNPHERTSETSYRQSRVAILVDRSMSMGLSAFGRAESPSATQTQTRAELVTRFLDETPLIEELRETHEVSFYTYAGIEEPTLAEVFRTYDPRVPGQQEGKTAGEAADDTTSDTAPDWTALIEPDAQGGLESRLGDALKSLIDKISGETLSGVVVLSDGVSNAGRQPDSILALAKNKKVRLVTVGLGGTQREPNLRVAGVNAPTHVQMGDAFEIRALVQGQSLAGRAVEVELLRGEAGSDAPPIVVAGDTKSLEADGEPVEFVFERDPAEVGEFEYTVRAKSAVAVLEQFQDDNERKIRLRVTDEPLRILLVAGGPMRDYRFVRNMLFRHAAINVDVWLQTIEAGDASSQESDNLLVEFPSREELLGNGADLRGYDVIVAFDPNWEQLTADQNKLINEFVFKHAGGLVLVAGDVYTKELARAIERSEELNPIMELYPVVLSAPIGDFEHDYEADQDWKLAFTREGQEAGFLQVDEDPRASRLVWDDFGGFYRCYPTEGGKAGAIVYANFTDPRAQNEFGAPIVFASQFFGSGRTLYVGSPELWRLRSIDEEYFDRFWTKLVRELGQTRQKRGGSLGSLLPERRRYTLGQSVRVRAILLDPQSEPLVRESVELDVIDPQGRPILPRRVLLHDENRPGQYIGDFRAAFKGTYALKLNVPESTEVLEKTVEVSLPNLEFKEQRQDAQLLRQLADETGGTYRQVTSETDLDELRGEIVAALPSRGQEFTLLETIDELWDEQWVMYFLVALLSIEWLIRKLLKLA